MTDPLVPSRQARVPDRDVLRLAATTVAASLLVWWPAFTLGVYRTIFFEQIFALWAAATSAFLVGVFMLRRRAWAKPAVYSLLLPSVWMVVTWLTSADVTPLGLDVLFWIGVFLTLIGLPAMVSLMILVAVPGAETVRKPGRVAVAVSVIAIVGVSSFIVGHPTPSPPHLRGIHDQRQRPARWLHPSRRRRLTRPTLG